MKLRLLWTAALLLCLFASGAGKAGANSAAWPEIALPPEVSPFEVGEQLTVNGQPMRIRGFLAATSPERLAQWFRQRLGRPIVEDVVRGKHVLGQAQGEYYLTIQLERAGAGTRALVVLTHMTAALNNKTASDADRSRILAGFPIGSRLLNHVTSFDGGKASTYVVVANRYDEQLNVERLKEWLASDGMTVERDTGADAGGRSIFFRGAQREAVALVTRDPSGQTAIVMNTVSTIGVHK